MEVGSQKQSPRSKDRDTKCEVCLGSTDLFCFQLSRVCRRKGRLVVGVEGLECRV